MKFLQLLFLDIEYRILYLMHFLISTIQIDHIYILRRHLEI